MKSPAALLLLTAIIALGLGACASANAASTEATITIHYSHFSPEVITARPGMPITVTIHNEDPIEHEWIAGTADVHQRHRTGTEPYHDQIPTEVTIPALPTRTTTVVFNDPGEYLYICHLPGHEAYGMVGTLRVVEG